MRLVILVGGIAAAVAFFLPWYETPVGQALDGAALVSPWSAWTTARECLSAAAASPGCDALTSHHVYLIVALVGAVLGILVGLVDIPVVGRLLAIGGGVATLVACGWLGMLALNESYRLLFGIFVAGGGGVLLIFGGLAANGR